MAVTVRIEVTHHSWEGSTLDKALRSGLIAKAAEIADDHSVVLSRIQLIKPAPRKKGS